MVRALMLIAHARPVGGRVARSANQTAIGTLVERSTGYAILVHLPDGCISPTRRR